MAKRRKRRRRYILCPRCQGALEISLYLIAPAGHVERVTCTLCAGSGRYVDRPISKHFRLKEFLWSQTAARKGIDNSPAPEIISNLKKVAKDLLEPIRAQFGPIKVTSGYRSYELNDAIGGSPSSAHPKGGAADIVPYRRVHLKNVVDWAIKSNLPYDQIIFEGTWIHLGLFRESVEDAPRRRTLMMFAGKYYEYDPEDSRVIGVE